MGRTATFRESDLARAIRVFLKMGLPVTGATITRAGEIQILTASLASPSVEKDLYQEWKSKRGDRAA